MSAGRSCARSTAARTTWPPNAGASVSLNTPRYALPIGVRATDTMTASFMSYFLYGFYCYEWLQVVTADGVGHAAGFGLAVNVHGDANPRLHAALERFGAQQLADAAKPRADAHRRGKADLVAAVIDAEPRAVDPHDLR